MKDLKTTLFESYHETSECYQVAAREYATAVGSGMNANIQRDSLKFWEYKRLALFDLISEAGLKTEYDLWEAEQEEADI